MSCNYCKGTKVGQAKLGWFCGGGGKAEWNVRPRSVSGEPSVVEVECSNMNVKTNALHGFRVSIPAKYCPHCGQRI